MASSDERYQTILDQAEEYPDNVLRMVCQNEDVLLIGRVKREPNVRVIVHDKSSLAPEGKPVAFCLDPETGFSWIGEYDITADELLSGAGGNTATKTEQAERLILDLLADGKELASEDIVKACLLYTSRCV